MPVFKFALLLIILFSFTLTIFEYISLRKMINWYYRNGPFAIIDNFKLRISMDALLPQLKKKEYSIKFYLRTIGNTLLISFRSSLSLFYLKGEFPTQRIVLTFFEEPSGFRVHCEVRPFYSAFILPASIALFMIVNFIFYDPFSNITTNIVGISVACLFSFAIFLPFRPKKETLQHIKNILVEFAEK